MGSLFEGSDLARAAADELASAFADERQLRWADPLLAGRRGRRGGIGLRCRSSSAAGVSRWSSRPSSAWLRASRTSGVGGLLADLDSGPVAPSDLAAVVAARSW
jgi:hypothetical protein